MTMKSTHRIGLVILLMPLILGGCITGKSAPTHFYVLDSLEQADSRLQTPAGRDLTVQLGPVSLAEYLNRPQIVTRTGRNRLHFAEFHQWGEPLQDGVSRVLAENLSILLGTDRVEIIPSATNQNPDYRFIVDLVRLDGRLGGKVDLIARWTILGNDGKRIIAWKRSVIREATVGSSYQALAAAESRALARLCRDMAAAVAATGS